MKGSAYLLQWKLFVFLGYLFSQEGVKPDPTKIEAIRDIPTSKYGVMF